MEFKGTLGNWKHTKIANEIIEGADSSKILGSSYDKVIGRVNATHKEEGYSNLKLIVHAPELLSALEEAITGLEWHKDDDPIKFDKSDEEKLHDWKELISKILY